MEWKKIQKSLVDIINHPAVGYASIVIVIAGDCLALANMLPKHSLYLSRPFHGWRNKGKKKALTKNSEVKQEESVQIAESVQN
ncbi:uncharacterized protein [Drosophila tropicalis]|uniref:uncharacterized protein n=1 Tax=Drosophila tropicalis TaxID=46794 RepID=UPI0035AC1446